MDDLQFERSLFIQTLSKIEEIIPILELLEDKNSSLLTDTVYLNNLAQKKSYGQLLLGVLSSLTEIDPHLQNCDLIYVLTSYPENAPKLVEAILKYHRKMGAAPSLSTQQALIESGFHASDVCDALISCHFLEESITPTKQDLQRFTSIAPKVGYVLYGFLMAIKTNPDLSRAHIFRLFFENAIHIEPINLGLTFHINFHTSLLSESVLTTIIAAGDSAPRIVLERKHTESPLLLSAQRLQEPLPNESSAVKDRNKPL